jgi:hypothetical protein
MKVSEEGMEAYHHHLQESLVVDVDLLVIDWIPREEEVEGVFLGEVLETPGRGKWILFLEVVGYRE